MKKKLISISLISLLILITLLTSGCIESEPEYKHYTGKFISVLPSEYWSCDVPFYFDFKSIDLDGLTKTR